MDILIIYGSLEGQTRKISERIAALLQNKGHQATALSSEHLPADFQVETFDAVIIGGPVHMGKYPSHLRKFVTRSRNWLNEMPTAFFTVCMAINSEHTKSREQAIHYGKSFLKQTGWQPALTETFAGAVKYTQYGVITRYIMQMISKREGGSTDTTRDHEYTDWEKVSRFAEEFLSTVLVPEAIE
jgi:menaquinone-dependent protoporphyrinogen oxidase